jgi:AraC-like DNA-binding protein
MAVYLPDEQKYIDKLTEIVEENFSNPDFGVAELAREVGLSQSTIHRKLKAIARQSISQFIRETRLKRAMELLRLQAGSVAEIAFGVGFSSTTYFSNASTIITAIRQEKLKSSMFQPFSQTVK